MLDEQDGQFHYDTKDVSHDIRSLYLLHNSIVIIPTTSLAHLHCSLVGPDKEYFHSLIAMEHKKDSNKALCVEWHIVSLNQYTITHIYV